MEAVSPIATKLEEIVIIDDLLFHDPLYCLSNENADDIWGPVLDYLLVIHQDVLYSLVDAAYFFFVLLENYLSARKAFESILYWFRRGCYKNHLETE